jgi:hypothetical protein
LQGWARHPGSLEALGNVAHVRHDASVDLAASCDSVTMHVSTDEAVMLFVTGEQLDGLRPGSVLDHHGTGQRDAVRIDLCGSARRLEKVAFG